MDNTFMSLKDDTLGISLEAPAGWSRSSTDVFPLQLFAPEREDGYRPVCNFSHERYSPVSEEGLTEFLTKTREAQASGYEGFEDLGTEQVLIDNRPGTIQRYTWEPEGTGVKLDQLLALIAVEDGLLLEVDTAVPAQLADRYYLVFERIIRSVRFL